MTTVTKTFTENGYSSNKSTWTVTMGFTDITTSSGVFSISGPNVTAKYVGSNKGIGTAQIQGYITIDGTVTSHKYFCTSGTQIQWSSGTTKNQPNTYPANTHSTSTYFNSTNKTQKTVDVSFDNVQVFGASEDSDFDHYNYYDGTANYGVLGTITLNAPPQVTLGTPTYATPQYAGLGLYSVPLTSLTAQYGGDISTVVLTVGNDFTTQTYSSNTVTNQTISVVPTTPGTFTPTVTVTDSRGQTTTTPITAITVNAYAAPSVNMDVFRSDSSGVKDDEGTYGLITADVSFTSAVATITQPVVTIDGTTTNNVTWYANYNSSTGVSSAISDWTTVDSADTIYGLINGSFSGSQSYVIGITVSDSEGGSSATITQTLSTAFYTIDFQAGGKEIAFGGPANDNLTSYPDGLFKCDMDVIINGDAKFNGDLTAAGDTSVQGLSVGGDISAVGNNTFATGNTEIENPYFSIDTTASPGTTDGDLYAAINTLGWTGDISSGLLTVKGLLTDILGLEGNLITIVTASDSGSSSSGTDKFWDIYAPTKDGVFLGLLHVSFASNTSGRRAIRCYTSIGGTRTFTNMIATIPPVSGAATEITIPVVIKLTSSQTFGVRTYQNGGSLNVTVHLEGVYITP